MAQNTIEIRFKEKTKIKEAEKALDDFKENLGFINDVFSENISDDDKYFISCEMDFESKWSAPVEILEKLAKRHDLEIIGTSWEFSSNYAEAFKFPKEKELKNYIIISTDCLPVELEIDINNDDPEYAEFDNSTVLGRFEAETPEKAKEKCKKMILENWEIKENSLPEMILYEIKSGAYY